MFIRTTKKYLIILTVAIINKMKINKSTIFSYNFSIVMGEATFQNDLDLNELKYFCPVIPSFGMKGITFGGSHQV